MLRSVACSLLVASMALASCKTSREIASPTLASCIQPPVTGVKTQDEASREIAAKLANVKLDANAKASFKHVLDAEFSTLSDRNVSLLLFLRAIDCYSKQPRVDPAVPSVGEDIARDLASMVRQEWATQTGFRGVDGPITPLERAFISKSAFSSEIMDHLTRRGL